MKVLAASKASPQFVKSLLAQAAIDGVPSQVLEYFLGSDIDGDGRTLAQEIFQDGTNPLEPDSPQPTPKAQISSSSPTEDLEMQMQHILANFPSYFRTLFFSTKVASYFLKTYLNFF
ncbi:hypothetical protein NIES2111_59600 (plasmid) [Nostoc sp. NIES-2111]|nr:hypothetical protein NIES2111_59600 [Nostoc sp. NIES-2111]